MLLVNIPARPAGVALVAFLVDWISRDGLRQGFHGGKVVLHTAVRIRSYAAIPGLGPG